MLVANTFGSYVCVDESTSSGITMDITRILIRVNYDFVLPESISVSIDKELLVIKLREDSMGPVRIVYN